MNASMQVLKIALKVLLVVPTCQPIHSSCSILLEFRECLCEVINTDVVEERGELLLLPLPCSLPYALQRLCPGSPVLCRARAWLSPIPLGPRPWLHQLRSRLPGFVRWLHSYYGGVRLLMIVHHRLRLLAFPTRASAARMRRWPTMRSPGSQAKSVRTCQCLRPRRAVWALALSRPSVLPSVTGTTSAPRMRVLSRLNGWPMRSPVNASPMPSRASAHDSGSMRFGRVGSRRGPGFE